MNEKRYYAIFKEDEQIRIISFSQGEAETVIRRLKEKMNLTETRLTKKNNMKTSFFDMQNIKNNQFVLIYGQEVDKIDI